MALKKQIATFLFAAIILGGEIYASSYEAGTEPSGATVIHLPVTSLRQNEKLVVEARLDGATERIVFMRLYFKSSGADSYDYLEMSRGSAGYYGEVPPERISGAKLSYFILTLLEDQEVVTYPRSNPYGNPVEVRIAVGSAPVSPPPLPTTTPPVLPQFGQPLLEESIPEQSSTTPGEEAVLGDSPILFLSPENGEEFGVGEELVIAVSLFPTSDDSIEVNSLNLYVDGLNVSLEAEISVNLITYTSSTLTVGGHSAFVQGYFVSGVELPRAEVTFIVKGDRAKSETGSPIRARVFAETRNENISDVSFHDNNIGGFLSGEHGFVKYDARLFLTTREDSQFQPRNRYSFNLELPVLGVTVGDFYPRFNDLMLWGKRVRGVHGRLHLGFFNVDFVSGQTVRKVSATFETVIDTTTNLPFPTTSGDSTEISTTGTYAQKLLGLRTSFGSGKNFQLGINVLKVKDDSTAINGTSLGSQEFSTTPQDNIVLGTDLMLGFANRRIEFRAGAAFSLITEDILGGPLEKADIDSLTGFDIPIDPADYADFLIINLSTKPLEDPRKGKSLALNASFRFNFFNNNFMVGYKRIGSEYTSLGNSFLRNNLQGFFIQDRIRLLQNKLYLNLGFESYDDNFSSDDDNDPTKLRTVNSGFTVYPGAKYPSLSFNIRNYNRDNGLSALFDTSGVDTAGAENNTTRDWSLQTNYNTRFMNINHSISLSYITSKRADQFVPETENSSNVQVVTVRSKYQFPLVTTVNFARNDNNFGNGLNTFNFKMFGLKAEYPFFNRKLKTYAGMNFTASSGISSSDSSGVVTQTAATDYSRLAINVGARYDISSSHYVAIDASLISFKDKGWALDESTTPTTTIQNDSFTDRIFRLYYEKRF